MAWSLAATTVSTTRSTTAAPEPRTTAFICWCAGSVRAASAITTALSPDRMMLIQMILTSPIQNSALCRNSIDVSSDAGALQQCLQQLGHFGRVARDLETTLLHDGEFRFRGVGPP